ncbi:MAG: hypothetical protein ACI92I_000585 [Acidimicrobiales bacterium]|jgi:hypothetical protein
MIGMVVVHVIISYFLWHYTVAFRQIFIVWTHLLWYVAHLFSLGVLLRTLLSPWKRMNERYTGGFSVERFFEVFVLNILSRFVGCCVKVPLIMVGSLTLLLMSFGLVFFYVCWILLPVIIGALFVTGISYIYVF